VLSGRLMVAAGFPYLVAVARMNDTEIIFSKVVGGTTRHPNFGDFEDLMKKMLNSNSMKSLPEKILKVDDMNMYIAYRKDPYTGPEGGIVFFVFVPKSYNKSELRKLLKEVADQFKQGTVEADIDDDNIGSCSEKALNKKSQIKTKINDCIDKYGEGVAMTDKILAQLDKNKALMSENIDSMVARTEQLEDTLKMTEELVENTSAFADKAATIKRLMMLKNLKMLIGLVVLIVIALLVVAYQLGLFG